MKCGNSVAYTFIIKHTKFGYDAFRFDISILHCIRLQIFRGDSVFICLCCTLFSCFECYVVLL